MIKAQSDRWVALSVVFCSVVLVLALMLALGKFSLNGKNRLIKAHFESVSGINPNTTVKYAGATVGRVKSIEVLPRSASVGQPRANHIQMVISVRQDLDLGDDVTIEIKQDGLLGGKYVGLTPGAVDAPPLAADHILQGQASVELADLAGPGKALLADLMPVAKDLKAITGKLNENLPSIIAKLDSLLANGDGLLASVNTPEGKLRIQSMLSNVKVVSDNLKVITTQAKGMTTSLGEKPWSLIWGGEPNVLPSEAEILASDKALPIKRPAPEKMSEGKKPKTEKPKR
jgi:phospholipid/cholesterol/gamma-HCH transport system substrate-binding protein